MHEMSMAHEICEIVRAAAAKNGLSRVSEVVVRYHAASHQDPEPIREAAQLLHGDDSLLAETEFTFLPQEEQGWWVERIKGI